MAGWRRRPPSWHGRAEREPRLPTEPDVGLWPDLGMLALFGWTMVPVMVVPPPATGAPEPPPSGE